MSRPITERITAAEAAEHLPGLLARVMAEGAGFEITNGADVIAEVVPEEPGRTATLRELDQLLSWLPPLHADDAADREALVDDIRREGPARSMGLMLDTNIIVKHERSDLALP